MHRLYRDKYKNQMPNATVSVSLSVSEQAPSPEVQRRQARIKMVLYCLNDRMRVFGPMMVRVMTRIESEHGLVVVFPKTVTYGGGDPYFPTYEWQILPKHTLFDNTVDPRKLTVALRASPGNNLSEIMVYYLVSFVDANGDEHPLHRLPTDFRNETMINALLRDGIRAANLTSEPGDPIV